MISCPTSERWRLYLEEQLEGAEKVLLTEHLETCPECLQVLERLTTGAEEAHWRALARQAGGAKPLPMTLKELKESPSFTREPLAPPQIPDYEILKELGAGAMGVVYLARQSSLKRHVAIKVMLGQGGPEELARFQVEAQAVAQFDHPNLVKIHEVGVVEHRPYLVLEYVGGGSLAQRLVGRPLVARQAAELTRTLARAVHHAHLKGIIHRDLKPSNILLTEENDGGSPDAPGLGAPKIADFGLAKRLQPDADSRQTQSGAILGTPSYMAPEQALGHVHEISKPTDVYALGAILYELLSGRPPFRAASVMETIEQVIHEEPVPPSRLTPNIPADLETICLKCLEKAPAQRYAGADELAEDLTRFLDDEPILARKPHWWERLRRWRRRHPMAAAFGILAVVLVIVGAILTDWSYRAAAAEQAAEFVRDFCLATPGELDRMVEKEWPVHRSRGLSLARAVAEDPAAEPGRRWRASLLLLPEKADFLGTQMLAGSLDDMAVSHRHLAAHRERIVPSLVAAFRNSPQDELRRFHAGLALAGFGQAQDWIPADIGFVVDRALLTRPEDRGLARALLRPSRDLVRSTLVDRFQHPRLGIPAADFLLDLFGTDGELLAELLSAAGPEQFRKILAVFGDEARFDPAISIRLISRRYRDDHDARLRELDPKKQVDSSQRKVRSAFALLHLGDSTILREGYRSDVDPDFIGQATNLAMDFLDSPDLLRAALRHASTARERYGLILGIGEFLPKQATAEDRHGLVQSLSDWHVHDPDPAVHSATAWLLRRWNEPIPGIASLAQPPAYDPRAKQGWFALAGKERDLTFIVMAPGSFSMGSDRYETFRVADENLHVVTFSRAIAMLDQEVPTEWWLKYLQDTGQDVEAWKKRDERLIPFVGPGYPTHSLTWHEAILFCRWLTTQAGMNEADQCYREGVPPSSGVPRWEFDPTRRGFRLPTEAEWERACRAGTRTTYSFGSDPTLARRFCVSLEYSDRQPAPCRTTPPNPWGVFDLHGNVWEWCQDGHRKVLQDETDPVGDPEAPSRVYRGGSFDNYARHQRAACRINDRPNLFFPYVGFRVVCTLPTATDQ